VILVQPNTHALMAQIIYRIVNNDHSSLDLNYKSFRHGCIRPDFIPKPLKVPNYKRKSFEYLLSKIEKIQQEFLPDSDKNLKRFSVKLGIITHYLADYFCLAHNDPKYNFFPLHFAYEKKLSQQFSQLNETSLKIIQDRCFSTINENNVTRANWLGDYINKKHQEYLDCPETLSKDTMYSLEVCLTAILVIIKKIFSNLEKAAA